MTVAYCVLSHTLPEQVLRLARTLRAGSAGPILIHHDPSGPRLDRPALDGIGGVRQIAPVGPVAWGRGSQLDALLALVAAAVATDADWVVLLSGQDFPARPLADVEADLAASAYDGYVDGHVVEPPAGDPDEFQRRYFYRWAPLTGTADAAAPASRPAAGSSGIARVRARAVRAVARRVARPLAPRVLVRDVPSATLVGVPARRTPFGPALPCRRGQDWLTLHRRAAEALVHAARAHPQLVDFYRGTVLPTESFPHTVLHAEPGLRLSGDSRRFVRFPPGSPNPRVLTLADVDAIRASGTDFARKFDDPRVLDALVT